MTRCWKTPIVLQKSTPMIFNEFILNGLGYTDFQSARFLNAPKRWDIMDDEATGSNVLIFVKSRIEIITLCGCTYSQNPREFDSKDLEHLNSWSNSRGFRLCIKLQSVNPSLYSNSTLRHQSSTHFVQHIISWNKRNPNKCPGSILFIFITKESNQLFLLHRDTMRKKGPWRCCI